MPYAHVNTNTDVPHKGDFQKPTTCIQFKAQIREM